MTMEAMETKIAELIEANNNMFEVINGLLKVNAENAKEVAVNEYNVGFKPAGFRVK